MTSEDAEPLAVMSRGKSDKDPGKHVTTGARSCTYRPSSQIIRDSKRKKPHTPSGPSRSKSKRTTPKKSRFLQMALSPTERSQSRQTPSGSSDGHEPVESDGYVRDSDSVIQDE